VVVKPLYKKGDESSMTNYSPVSLLTVFSKVFDKAMHILTTYWSQNSMVLGKGYLLKMLPSD
jgi:hypothetical protein